LLRYALGVIGVAVDLGDEDAFFGGVDSGEFFPDRSKSLAV